MTARPGRSRAALACCMLALGGTAAHAQEGADPFAKVAPSIARMNYSGFHTMGHCTAVQVGRRAALAAASCIEAVSFEQIHFLFGYDRQKWAAHRVGRKAFSDPSNDELTLFCLDAALPAPRFALRARSAARGERAILAGYAAPRIHKVTFRTCPVEGSRDASATVLGCGIVPGDAGAAVFTLERDGARLLGVAVAGNAEITVSLRWTGEAPDHLCPPDAENSASESNG